MYSTYCLTFLYLYIIHIIFMTLQSSQIYIITFFNWFFRYPKILYSKYRKGTASQDSPILLSVLRTWKWPDVQKFSKILSSQAFWGNFVENIPLPPPPPPSQPLLSCHFLGLWGRKGKKNYKHQTWHFRPNIRCILCHNRL